MARRFGGISGQETVKILEKHFGFIFISQKGSHLKLRKTENEKTITTIIPNHPELAEGTLRNVLKQAQVDFNDFLQYK